MRRLIMVCVLLVFVPTIFAFAEETTLAATMNPADQAGGIRSIEDRVKKLEEAVGRKVEGDKWYDRLMVGGVVEVEVGYGNVDYKDPVEPDEKNNDVDLAKAEVALDAKIADHADGHLLYKYEEDRLFVDEGFITLTGTKRFPAYLIVGRQYVPFGNFDSHFVTDPSTLILGETNEGAAVVGYCFWGEMIDVSAGAFNGEARKGGDDADINSFLAAVTTQPMEGINIGVSYTSNLAASGAFNAEMVNAENLDSLVGAWSAFATYTFLERFKLIGEYIAALDRFRAGEVYDAADAEERKPSAWNVELGVALIDNLVLALRFGGADDGGVQFLPETQYGAVLNWGFFKNTNLALEYLHGEFEEAFQKTDAVTLQLAMAF